MSHGDTDDFSGNAGVDLSFAVLAMIGIDLSACLR